MEIPSLLNPYRIFLSKLAFYENLCVYDSYMNCRVCGRADLVAQWDFGKIPYGDTFTDSRETAQSLQKYPLVLGKCMSCQFLQLVSDPINLDIYQDYLYRSSSTVGLLERYRDIARHLDELSIPKECRKILDIGCNDGTFLKCFKTTDLRVGIDPSPSLRSIEENSLILVNEFFGIGNSARVIELAPFDIITTNFTLANVNNPQEFISLASELMHSDSILSIVTGYHPDQFSLNMFEYINHDHISYFRLTDLERLLVKSGLKVIYASRFEEKGGSLQVVAKKTSSSLNVSREVEKLRERESTVEQFARDEVYQLRRRVERQKDMLVKSLAIFNQVDGVGASISTSGLIRYFGLEAKIKCLYDDNEKKFKRFNPGAGIPVFPLSEVKSRENKSPLVIFAWQHKKAILQRLKKIGFEGQILVPLPALEKADI